MHLGFKLSPECIFKMNTVNLSSNKYVILLSLHSRWFLMSLLSCVIRENTVEGDDLK